MVSRATIDDFVAQRSLALVGVSRSGRGFGNTVRKELGGKGYTLHLVHPEVDAVAGVPCVKRLQDLAGKVGGVILVTPPAQTLGLVREAAEAGITRVWMQQGAESAEAVRLAEEKSLHVVHGHCILMFSDPVGFPHSVHRWLKRVGGTLPR
jgi:hypothetical protein